MNSESDGDSTVHQSTEVKQPAVRGKARAYYVIDTFEDEGDFKERFVPGNGWYIVLHTTSLYHSH